MALQLTRAPEHARDRPSLLLAVLALGGPSDRAALAALLWEDSAHARSNLRVELHRLTRGPFAGSVDSTGTHIVLRGGVVSDVTAARERAAAGDAAGALAAASPELLPWVTDAGGTLGEWLHAARADWAAFYRSVLRGAAQQAEARGDLDGARAYVRHSSDLDPLSEDARREWLRLCVLLRDGPEARRVYADCEAMTRREFGRAPLVATRAWLEQLELAEAGSAGGATVPRLPLVGRAELLRTLQGTGVCTLLLGDPGVGKSRLAREFARQAERALVVAGVVAGGPLAAVAFTLDEVGGARLSARSQGALDTLRDTAAVQEFSAVRREELHAALAGALLEAAGPRGCVVFDDLHLLDAASLDVLGVLLVQAAQVPPGRRPALVGTARAFELRGSAAAGWVRIQRAAGHLRTLDVPPLTGADLLALIQHLSASAGGTQFAAALQETTGGNPLFFLETLRALIGSGHVRVDEAGRWHVDFQAAGGYGHLPLPRSVQEAVVHRADLLDGPVRRVLDTLSVQALPLGAPVLSQACALGEWEVVEAARTLEAAGFVHEVSAGYTLRHDLQREALQLALPGQRRGVLHAALAAALAQSGAAPHEVAQCFEAGGRAREAAAWWVRAAERSRRAYAMPEATLAYERALALGLDDDPAFRATLEVFRISMDALGELEQARAVLPALRGLRDAAPHGRAEYDLCEAQVHLMDAAYADSLAITEQVLALELPGPLLASARYLRGSARMKLGQLAMAEADFRASRDLDPQGRSSRAFQVALTLVNLAAVRGDHDLARTECTELRRLAAVLGDPASLARAEFVSGSQAAMAGENARARDALERTVALTDQHGLTLLGAQARANLGGLLLTDGQYHAALEALEAALPLLPEQVRPTTLGNLGVCRFMLGQVGAAFGAYREVVGLARTRGEALLALRRESTLLDMQLHCGAHVEDAALLTLLAETAALGSTEVEHVLHCLCVQAASLRGETSHPSEAVLGTLTPRPDELDRHAYTLGWAALRRGEPADVLRHVDSAPASARLSALRLLADPHTPDPGADPRASALDALLLAHARASLGVQGAAAEASERQAALEASWPEHGGAFGRLLGSLGPVEQEPALRREGVSA